jgi:putative oxidoreductase
MEHGSQKLFGFPGNQTPVGFAVSLMGLAGILEFFGGALLALGLFTRPVAFILSGQMAVAYLMAHLPKDTWPVLNGGELAALYCFLFLYFAAAGGGPWSVDEAVRGRR